jgi:hypothetical protein
MFFLHSPLRPSIACLPCLRKRPRVGGAPRAAAFPSALALARSAQSTIYHMRSSAGVGFVLLALAAHAHAQGTTAALDAIGPISLGKDGSLNRIANWDELTTQEREAAKRALQRRNAKRLKKLREEEARPRNPFVRMMHQIRRCLNRVLLPSLDFAEDFVLPIQSGSKKATTRWLSTSGGEPQLGRLRAGKRVRATCNRCAKDSREIGMLRITRTETVAFGMLSDELAAQEGLQDGDTLRSTLLRFYPALESKDSTRVLHFEMEGLPNAETSRVRASSGSDVAGASDAAAGGGAQRDLATGERVGSDGTTALPASAQKLEL